MKTLKMNKVSHFLVIGFFGISITGYSQNQKLSHQELKEARKAQMAANFYALDTLLNANLLFLKQIFCRINMA